MSENEDTRLRKAGRWGLYGAGAGATAYGLVAGRVLRNLGKPGLPISAISALHGAVKGGAIGAGVGALTYKKKRVELSRRLDDLIEFKASDKDKKARWAATAGGVTGATTGAGLGAYIGAAHPASVTAYTGSVAESMGKQFGKGMESLRDEMGESWRHGDPTEAFGHGAFTTAERDARLHLIKGKLAKRAALHRIGKYAGIGALGIGTLGALSGYAASRGGVHRENRKYL
jgi:hypothetical protein